MRIKTRAFTKRMLSAGASAFVGVLMLGCPFVHERAVDSDPIGITEIPSPNYESRDGQEIDMIVLHHTASEWDAFHIASFFSQAEAEASVHYIIDRDGSVFRCVPDELRAWHAGPSLFEGDENVNQRSIGIELCNLGDDSETYPKAQLETLVRLMARLSSTYSIPENRFVRHRDVAVPAGRKIDTSNNLDVDAVYAAVVSFRETDEMPEIAYAGLALSTRSAATARSISVRPGDTWESLSYLAYDTPIFSDALRAANPDVELVNGAEIALPRKPEANGGY